MEAIGLTPNNLRDLVLFLLPGVAFVYFFFHQIPDRKKSDFILIVLSVVFSVILNKLTASLFFLINFITNIGTNLTSDNTSLFGVALTVITLLASIVSAKFVKSKYFLIIDKKIFDVDGYPFGNLWNLFFFVKDRFVKVNLKDGSSYIGQLFKTSYNPDDNDQEIIIKNPYTFDRINNQVRRIKETGSMLLRAGSITSVEMINDNDAKEIYKIK